MVYYELHVQLIEIKPILLHMEAMTHYMHVFHKEHRACYLTPTLFTLSIQRTSTKGKKGSTSSILSVLGFLIVSANLKCQLIFIIH